MKRGAAAVVRPAALGYAGQSILDAFLAAGHSRPLVALADVLAASPPARTMQGVVLGVRERPEPVLLFAGDMDTAAHARVADVGGLLAEAALRLRVFTWRDVERACEQLAERVQQRLAPDDLSTCVIAGIPRGGLVIAALLAYALGVPRHRVQADGATDLTVVVDDCALSGVRIREHLDSAAAQRTVIALMCAHPDLCAAVERDERVIACVAGVDLRDHASALLGRDAESWRRRWSGRVPGRYHTALLDLPVFPWSEPQVRLYNEATDEVEPHWWLGPANACLEHRTTPPAIPVQVADDYPGIDRLSTTVVPVIYPGEKVALIDVDGNAGVTLTGVAMELWTAWMSSDRQTAAQKVADQYGQPIKRVAADLDDLLVSLADGGLLLSTQP